MAAAIVMGLSAIPPAIKGGLVLMSFRAEDEAISELIVLLAFYWGDVILSLVLAWGLWHLKNWARIMVIVVLSLAILAGFAAGGFAGIAMLALLGYVVYWFASNGEYFTLSKTGVPGEKPGNHIKSTGGTEVAEHPDARTFAAGITIVIGILVILSGLQSLLGDANAFGFYCNIPAGIALIFVGWIIKPKDRPGRGATVVSKNDELLSQNSNPVTDTSPALSVGAAMVDAGQQGVVKNAKIKVWKRYADGGENAKVAEDQAFNQDPVPVKIIKMGEDEANTSECLDVFYCPWCHKAYQVDQGITQEANVIFRCIKCNKSVVLHF
ncbi:MAG: hypothetical protein JW953_21965 [Anaerolineae bacterium]|nr:hypothetical protein [Anaerolineae bacterium]